MLEPGTPQMTIWRMLVACWTPTATNTHSQYVILIAFPLQQSLLGHAPMLRCTYIARLAIHVFISVSNQLDAQNLFHNKFYFMPLYVSSTCVGNM